MSNQPEKSISGVPPSHPGRREFITRCAGALGMAGLCLATGALLFDKQPPPLAGGREKPFAMPDYSVPGTGGLVAVAKGMDRARTLNQALDAIGGLETFVQPGDRVVVKVNAAFASPPSLGATTHPDLVHAMVKKCLGAGAKEVLVTDNPINDPESAFEITGIGGAARAAEGRVVLPQKDFFRPYSLPGGRLIQNWPVLARPLLEADKLIGLAPVKDHLLPGASLSMKNWYGLLGGKRNVFHQNIVETIVELAAMVQPTLVVLDGTRSLVKNGPTGGSLADLADTGTMIAGTNQVGADALGAALLGKDPASLPFLMEAQKRGLGNARPKVINAI